MQMIDLFIRSIVEDSVYIPKSSLYNMLLELYRLYTTNSVPIDKFYWEVMYLYYAIKFAK
ncbi:MAG: hypothetical protein K0S71_120 [Clostridia bacterium]|jgi:hypothetical protein|nr:hypothetical protein [Clostridia bacterium]